MKSFNSICKIFIATVFGASFIFSTAWADEEVPITSDEQVQELYGGKKWKCNWEDGPSDNKGTKVYMYDNDLSMKKITGKAESSYCPGVIGTFKSKIKKGKIEGKLKHGKPCLTTWGGYTLYKKADGSYYQKGTYSYRWTDGNTYGGEATCAPI